MQDMVDKHSVDGALYLVRAAENSIDEGKWTSGQCIYAPSGDMITV